MVKRAFSALKLVLHTCGVLRPKPSRGSKIWDRDVVSVVYSQGPC